MELSVQLFTGSVKKQEQIDSKTIIDKLNRRGIHKAFSAYKTAPPGLERESLRLEYIRLAEIHRSFLSYREIPFSDC